MITWTTSNNRAYGKVGSIECFTAIPEGGHLVVVCDLPSYRPGVFGREQWEVKSAEELESTCELYLLSWLKAAKIELKTE